MQQTILDNISVVIPIHTFDKEQDTPLLKTALNSIFTDRNGYAPFNITIVKTAESNLTEKEISDLLDNQENVKFLSFINNITENKDFQSQVNLFSITCTTEYFSILEFDDEYSDIIFKNFKEYSDSYKNVSLFLPVIIETTFDGQFQKMSSVEGLSRGVTNTIGILTHEAVTKFPSFILSGGIFKTRDFNVSGKLKSNIRLAFLYEYLMRVTHLGQVVMIIPKIGYLHKNGRPGSHLMQVNDSGITGEEVGFWFEKAKSEFYFPIDRNISYDIVDAEEVISR
jgi:hypothetical protein